MKNTTLLKVLSATAIFSAIAAIEAYDQDNFAFAAETPVVASNSTSTTGANPATTTAAPAATAPTATTPATTTPKAEEPATVAQDVKALKDGEYKITAEALKFHEEGRPSMAAAGLDNEKTKLIVKNGQYSVSVTFKPITLGAMSGYLGDLKYYDGDKTHTNREEIKDSEFKDSTIVENYAENEKDAFIDTYKEEFPNRTVYPKTVTFNVDKNKIDANNKLETFTKVFVPVMESIGKMSNNPGTGTQRMILKFDLSSLSRTKVTADNYEAATYKNPNKDVEYKGTIKTHIDGKVKIGFPDGGIHVQGHFRNANNNDEESLYGSALDSYVKIEKVGEKYKYTLRFKKGLANVGGEFYPFELKKLAYEGKDVPFTTLAKNADSSINEASITTDKLLEKIQLDGTAPYPNGALMSHFVTLKLYYETATPYTERPAKIEEVVVPAKPKPVTPAPPKPKEEPKPATPTVPDHAVTADKVPTTFPTTVKGELYGRTTGKASIYEKAFVKDVKVEKVGDKYQYTIQVKEGQDNSNFLMRNKPFTVSKLTYKGTEVSFTEVDAATKLKEGKILTDSLLDKIQVDAVMSVRTKGGAKPRYEERNADSTITLDFPTVEKVKEEAANNLVPAKINNAHVTNKSSMADGALVHEKTRVEKVNDTYHYYLTFKDLNIGAQAGTVEKLTVDGTVAERTDLGGSAHEKVFHFTSPEKLTEKTITFSVNVGGVPLVGHSNVPATLKFNWDAATPLTADQVTAAHQEEAAKAQAEAARLEKEKAEREKAEEPAAGTTPKAEEPAAGTTPKAEEPAAGTTPKAEEPAAGTTPKAEEPAAGTTPKAEEPAAGTTPKTEEPAAGTTPKAEEPAAGTTPKAEEPAAGTTPKAEADRLEKERLKKEAAAKAQAEKEKALKEAVEKIQAENKKVEKEAEAAEETVTKLKADKAKLEKLVKEKEEAINNATTEVEKEKLATEKATFEKELTKKATELKAENEKVVNLKFEVVKNKAVENIVKDRSLNDKEAEQLKAIVKTASLKDTLVAKVVENDPSQDVTVIFDNTAIQAKHLVVQKADEKTVADVKEKVEELAKKADKNLSVVKTIDLHFADSNGNKINKQGETRAVTVAVVANEGEKLEVYYVRETDDKNIVLEKVPSVYKDGNLTFFTNHFSRYTIVKVGKTVATDQNTPVPVTPSTDPTKPVVTDKNEALTQPELPALNINELSKEQNVKEETIAQNTSQTVAKGLKQLAKTGLNATATAGLGVLALLSALVLRRKNNK